VAYGNDAGTANIWNLSPTDCVNVLELMKR